MLLSRVAKSLISNIQSYKKNKDFIKTVNLCARPSSAQGESTSQQLTLSNDRERFQYDEEMDILMQNLDSQKLRINPSARTGDFLEDLVAPRRKMMLFTGELHI